MRERASERLLYSKRKIENDRGSEKEEEEKEGVREREGGREREEAVDHPSSEVSARYPVITVPSREPTNQTKRDKDKQRIEPTS